MRTFLATLVAVFLIALPVAEHAEAKRLGGGFSLGKSFSSPKKAKPAPTQQKQAAPNQAQKNAAPTTTPKRKGFGGLMAGLLAGGIFGALLFGGAFDGIQFMDLLLIAAVIFIIYKIMSMRRQSQPQPTYANEGAQQYEINPHQAQQREAQQESTPEFKPMPSFSSGWGEESQIKVPSWFNEEAFLEGARSHFMKLQDAWDKCNWDEIRTYTSDDLFKVLQEERAKLPADQVTEVVSVMSELANFIDNKDEVIVSINFYGWLKEDAEETTEFNETWHLSRDMTKENADWFIIGIQQN
ncbi:TIM44-like domain-containing protein [Neptuniibacter sp.]|uniref:Tim44 domain-containing protein n=1 Tax=Neptuniibacter sp. TaxID=1962643 RepID=UPI00261D07C4|nr:TIM44-like domain-containing protein [Neptuniibacter sp.]MCP4595692.1 TIM44-like domain-containing protein [Neptuniibacter sp.]